MLQVEELSAYRRPDAILHSLVGHRETVDASATVESVHQLLMESGRDYVAIVEDERLVGICSRTLLGMLLGRRYGYALYGRRPIREQRLPEFLAFVETTPIQEVLQKVFSRPSDHIYDDIALLNTHGRLIGLIPVRSLVTLQNRILSEKLTEVERQERTLRTKNHELELLATKLNETNEDLNAANKAALEAARHKSEFLANMSHEIRTPMNGVLGMINLLLETPLEAEQRFYAVTVQESAESLLRIINDILDFSKIEAGRLEVENERFSLAEVIESSLMIVAEAATKKNLELLVDLDPELPTEVLGDATRLRQILTNLVGNAVKFTEEGQVLVRAEFLAGGQEHVQVRIAVEDSGSGIPEAAQAQLFQPFRQADGTSTRKHGGTGLGLAISKRLVELLGGQIGFRSKPGKGSTFWIHVPFHAEQPAETVAPVPEGTQLLLLERHEQARKLYEKQLRRCGYEVQAPASKEEIEERLQAHAGTNSRVVVSLGRDATLEDLVISQLRAGRLAPTQVVGLCPLGARPPEEMLRLCGADAFLYKPVRLRELLRSLVQHHPKSGRATENTRQTIQEAGGIFILVVEDIPTNQKVIQLLLRSLGHRFMTANNGREALEALREHRFDLVLMDCQMPEMDGYEATRQIRAGACGPEAAALPIIAMTAHAMRGDDEKCYEAGMNDYLTKPLRKPELTQALARHTAVNSREN